MARGAAIQRALKAAGIVLTCAPGQVLDARPFRSSHHRFRRCFLIVCAVVLWYGIICVLHDTACLGCGLVVLSAAVAVMGSVVFVQDAWF